MAATQLSLPRAVLALAAVGANGTSLRVNVGSDGTTSRAPCAGAPLVSVLRSAVDDVDTFAMRVMQIASLAKEADPNASTHRNFGRDDYKKEGGHKVTYINPAALAASKLVDDGAAFIDEIWSLARRAELWHGAQPTRMALRCLEVIEYVADDRHSLGYHTDGATFLTMAIPLTRHGKDFEGGNLVVTRDGCMEEVKGTLGDVMVWPGWHEHRVTPVTSGKRLVLVAEWWPATQTLADGTVDDLHSDTDAYGRPGDTIQSYLAALETPLAASSTQLHEDIGSLYMEQGEDEAHDSSAVEWLEKAAEQGRARSQYNLGLMHFEGRGVAQSDAIAVKWWQRAAEQGSGDAQQSLGVMYFNGRGVVQSDKTAVKWWRKAAECGSADAQQQLGVMYREGRGVKQSDKSAVKWWAKAAEQGSASAQHQIAQMCVQGRGIHQSDKMAVEWWKRAAEQGLVDAQYNLGLMFEDGRGVTQSDKTAVKWWRIAAEQGDADSQHHLGLMVFEGRGVKQSEPTALAWWRKAAEQGNIEAQKRLKEMDSSRSRRLGDRA